MKYPAGSDFTLFSRWWHQTFECIIMVHPTKPHKTNQFIPLPTLTLVYLRCRTIWTARPMQRTTSAESLSRALRNLAWNLGRVGPGIKSIEPLNKRKNYHCWLVTIGGYTIYLGYLGAQMPLLAPSKKHHARIIGNAWQDYRSGCLPERTLRSQAWGIATSFKPLGKLNKTRSHPMKDYQT